MKKHAYWYGEGRIAQFAMSAVDMALWDLKGKILGVPLYKLFGGNVHPGGLPACASTHPSKPSNAENAEQLAGYIDEGYQSVKVGFGKLGDAALGKDPDHDVDFVREVRKAIGDKPGFMVDLGYTIYPEVAKAIHTMRRFEEYNLYWVEEPLHPENVEGYRQLRAATNTSIATGEHEWTVNDHRRLIETDTVDVFGIDPGRAEGITGFRKTAGLIGGARRHFNAHAWSSAITSAASLHMSISSPHFLLFEYKPIRNPMQHEFVSNPIDMVDGCAVPPEGPGLGIDVLDEVAEKYRMA